MSEELSEDDRDRLRRFFDFFFSRCLLFVSFLLFDRFLQNQILARQSATPKFAHLLCDFFFLVDFLCFRISPSSESESSILYTSVMTTSSSLGLLLDLFRFFAGLFELSFFTPPSSTLSSFMLSSTSIESVGTVFRRRNSASFFFRSSWRAIFSRAAATILSFLRSSSTNYCVTLHCFKNVI